MIDNNILTKAHIIGITTRRTTIMIIRIKIITTIIEQVFIVPGRITADSDGVATSRTSVLFHSSYFTAVTERTCKSYCRVYKYSGGPLLRRGIEP